MVQFIEMYVCSHYSIFNGLKVVYHIALEYHNYNNNDGIICLIILKLLVE